MPKFKVSGSIKCWISCEVDIPQEVIDRSVEYGYSVNEMIIETAYDNFGGVMGYAGNGGTDKLVGVSESGESIYPNDEFEFTDVEQLK